MKKIFVIFNLFFLLFFAIPIFSKYIYAQGDYVIESFKSELAINQDTSLSVKETVEVNYPYEKHGIYRIIPVRYSYKGKTINSRLSVYSVTDEKGIPYKYEKSGLGQSIQLKIGNPEKTISGKHTYVISYKVKNVLQEYDGNYELYWNVTGHEWDTDILFANAEINSPFAKITKTECFASEFGSIEKECQIWAENDKAYAVSYQSVGYNNDFTVVLRLDSHNSLVFPTQSEKLISAIIDNWGYPFSGLPFLLTGYFWFKKGRDKKFAGENIYYEPKKGNIIDKPIFYREHLPTVYSPIQGYSPSQIGTIIDEKVDIHDIVAEIIEFARLKFIRIEKIEEKIQIMHL